MAGAPSGSQAATRDLTNSLLKKINDLEARLTVLELTLQALDKRTFGNIKVGSYDGTS